MTKLKVFYNKEKCIGAGNCVSSNPENFKLVEGKAVLKDSVGQEGIYAFDFDVNEEDYKKFVEAGELCPVNAILVRDMDKDENIVSWEVKEEDLKEVKAEYDDAKEFVLDPCGYFLIRLDRGKKEIEAGFCTMKNKVVLKIAGKKPIDIYQTVINKEKLAIRKDHAAYLGRELQKAYIALQLGIEYVQDDELDFDKRV